MPLREVQFLSFSALSHVEKSSISGTQKSYHFKVAEHKGKRLDRDQIEFEFKMVLNSNSIRFDPHLNPFKEGPNKRCGA